MAPPLVTISIPAYRGRYLRAALASAVAQTWRHREIIVSQDGDDPAVPEICAAFPEVALVRGPNLGLTRMWANFDHCLAVGSGTYVKMLLDDDWLDPDCVARMVGVLESAAGRDVTLVASRRWLIDGAGRRLGVHGGVPGVEGDVAVARGALWWPAVRQLLNFIGEMTTVMIRRADLVRFGDRPLMGFGPDAAFQRDLRLFLELNHRGRAVMFHRPLSAFRVHPGQTSDLMESEEYAFQRLWPWLALVERGVALGEINAAQHRHGLRQVERLRLIMIGRNPAVEAALEPVRRRLAELGAA